MRKTEAEMEQLVLEGSLTRLHSIKEALTYFEEFRANHVYAQLIKDSLRTERRQMIKTIREIRDEMEYTEQGL